MKSAISATAFAGSSAWRNGGHENSSCRNESNQWRLISNMAWHRKWLYGIKERRKYHQRGETLKSGGQPKAGVVAAKAAANQ
jgi:hypothetical protein